MRTTMTMRNTRRRTCVLTQSQSGASESEMQYFKRDLHISQIFGFFLQWNANAWMFNDKEEKCSGKVNTLASKLIDEYAKSWRASLALHFPQSFETKCICMPIPDSLEAHIHTHSCVYKKEWNKKVLLEIQQSKYYSYIYSSWPHQKAFCIMEIFSWDRFNECRILTICLAMYLSCVALDSFQHS